MFLMCHWLFISGTEALG